MCNAHALPHRRACATAPLLAAFLACTVLPNAWTVDGAPTSWWPQLFALGGGAPATAQQEDASGAHSAYLALKSLELEGLEHNLVTEMRRRSRTSTCWKDAVATLEHRCRSELMKEDQRSRLALRFTGCQLHHDGKINLASAQSPRCGEDEDVADCVGILDDALYPIYVQYRLHVDTLCFHAQEEMFQERTEVAVNMLDRTSSAALSRTKDLTRRSAEIAASLLEARGAQEHIMRETKAASEYLLHQQTAQQASLLQVSARLSEASHGVSDLQHAFNATRAAQHASMSAIQSELQVMVQTQAAAVDAARAMGTSLTDLVLSSERQLLEHHQHMEAMALGVQRVAREATQQQEAFLQAHGAVVEVLERVFASQQLVLGSAATLETVLFYFVSLCGMLLTTAVSVRTAGARAPCILMLGAACVAEMYNVPRLLFMHTAHLLEGGGPQLHENGEGVSGVYPAAAGDAAQRLFHRCVGLLLLCVVAHTAWSYVPYEERQRRLIQSELTNWWGRQLDLYHHATGPSSWVQQPPPRHGSGGAALFVVDQGDGSECTGEVWSPHPTHDALGTTIQKQAQPPVRKPRGAAAK